MAGEINFFDTYALLAINEQIAPEQRFLKDRYFPTEAGDIFTTNKVLTEFRHMDRKLAAFVSPRIGDIPVDRVGYEVHEYEPARIAPSRLLTLDDLKKRGFGEALYVNSTEAQRAARIIQEDMIDLRRRIDARLEWMCAQVFINNACTMQTYVDAATQGEEQYVKFYGDSSDHTYTIDSGKRWNATNGDVFKDVKAMARMLSKRGLPAADLLLGTDTADALIKIDDVRQLLAKTSGIITGEIDQQLLSYNGVAFMGVLNFGGFRLNVFSVDESYIDDSGIEQSYIPAKGAIVTAPKCGRLMYGAVTQIDYGSDVPTTHTGETIPKITVDQENDIRKLRIECRPLAAPRTYCPYIYAANAVN